VVNYGFDLSAPRRIALFKDDHSGLVREFWEVIWAKVLLLALCVLVFGAMIFSFRWMQVDWKVFTITFMMSIGYVLFPTWYFQGIQKLGLTAIFTFFVKLIFTLGIFLFLKNESDWLVVPILGTLGQIIVGIVAIVYAYLDLSKGFRVTSPSKILKHLKETFAVFASTVFISLYTVSNTVILGFFASHESVGFYAAGTKVIVAIQSIFLTPISQAFYPRMASLMAIDREKGIDYLRKLTRLLTLTGVPGSIALFFVSPYAVPLFLGQQFLPTIRVVEVLSPLPLLIGLSTIFGIQGALNLQMDKIFLYTIAGGAVINIILNLLLDGTLKEIGASVSWLATEAFITLVLLIALERSGIKLIRVAPERV